jgi:uncharacterized Zn-binding protein involved in type VI secretion
VAEGEPTVLIGGKWAARLCDKITCPMADPKPHVMGAITQSSKTVKIGGKFAARQFDRCDCTTVGMCGIKVPPVVGPSGPKQVSTDKDAQGNPVLNKDLDARGGSGPHAEAQADGSSDKNGAKGSASAEAHVGRGRKQGSVKVAGGELGGQAEGDLIAGDGQARGGYSKYGSGGSAEAQAKGVGVGGKAYYGPAGDGGNNPYVEVGANATGGSAEAKGDLLVGDDGNRVGVAMGGKAELGGGVGQVSERITIPLWGDNNIQIGAYQEGKLAEVGGGAGGHAYYDKNAQRVNLGFFAGLELWAGAEVGYNISIGKKVSPPLPPPPPAIPNKIVTGWPTVLIGD